MSSPSRSTLAIFLSLSSYNLFTPSCRPTVRLYWIFLHYGVNKNPPPLMQNPIANSPAKPKTFGDSQSSNRLLQEHRTQRQAADVDPMEGAPRKVLVGGELKNTVNYERYCLKRAANPVVHDARFGEDCSPAPFAPSPLTQFGPPASPKQGCAHAKFGLVPAVVRVEDFDCLNRGCRSCSGIAVVA
ncbi:hypothetical protein ZIOFF_009999 [Zingiber officinale]|uniref:Uncharacterized protein n=1 Tax=Zingiber officinale TaxID=94328 RepID=A0A8J5HNK5_ZINOF|nr:hypothetical protein ZIOFF_009999 [Zingiber officinale]